MEHSAPKLSMNVSLTAELRQLVENKVKTGLYQTASGVVREALRLKERHELEKRPRRKMT